MAPALGGAFMLKARKSRAVSPAQSVKEPPFSSSENRGFGILGVKERPYC